jgi:hypothetical protein
MASKQSQLSLGYSLIAYYYNNYSILLTIYSPLTKKTYVNEYSCKLQKVHTMIFALTLPLTSNIVALQITHLLYA